MASAEYGAYDIYMPDNTDERVETTIFDGMRETLFGARVRARTWIARRSKRSCVCQVRRR